MNRMGSLEIKQANLSFWFIHQEEQHSVGEFAHELSCFYGDALDTRTEDKMYLPIHLPQNTIFDRPFYDSKAQFLSLTIPLGTEAQYHRRGVLEDMGD